MSFEDNIRRVTPYTPGEQPKSDDLIKLNTNESPYPPSPLVSEAIKSFAGEFMSQYSWSEEVVGFLEQKALKK